MEASKLSEYYGVAAERCHKAITEFYEACHEENGDPITESEKLKTVVEVTTVILLNEIDLCVEAVKEYNNE